MKTRKCGHFKMIRKRLCGQKYFALFLGVSKREDFSLGGGRRRGRGGGNYLQALSARPANNFSLGMERIRNAYQ